MPVEDEDGLPGCRVAWEPGNRATRQPCRSATIRRRMVSKNIVHVVGTGTIGEPLIAMFCDFKEKWGIDEVTFHKRTPSADDRAMIASLLHRGARLASDEQASNDFARFGQRVSYMADEAIERATVVVDCTPAGH